MGKKAALVDPQRVTVLGEDSICMFNLLETPRVIVFFSDYMIDLLWLFQKRSFLLSSEHENQNVATVGTLLDQFMLSCKLERLARFYSVSDVLDRDKPRSLGNKML